MGTRAKATFTFETAPVIGHTDGLKMLCPACSGGKGYPLHADSDPECVPPTCAKCKRPLTPETQGDAEARP